MKAGYSRRIAAEATHCHKLGLRLPGSAVSTAPRELQEASERKARGWKLKRRNINNKRPPLNEPIMESQKPTGDRTADRKHFQTVFSHCNIGQGVAAKAIHHITYSSIFNYVPVPWCKWYGILQPPLLHAKFTSPRLRYN